MQLTINSSSAVAALSYIHPACKPKTTLQVLQNILIQPDGDNVKFTASTLEIELSTVSQCEWKDQGSITVDGKKLIDIFKNLPKDSDAVISISKGKAIVKCGRSRFSINTLPSEEFPIFSISGDQKEYNVDPASLLDAFERTFPAAAQQDVRYYLNGVNLNFNGETLDVVATDGHRLNLVSLGAVGDETSVIVPRDSVKPLTGVLGSSKAVLMISDSALKLSDGIKTVFVKLIDGRFPDFNRVVPSNNTIKVEFNRTELHEAVNRALVLSNEKYRGLMFSMASKKCNIQGRNASDEQSEESILCSYDSEKEYVIGFNGHYVIQAIAQIETDNVIVEFNENQTGSILIKDGSFKAVVMSMRL